MERRHYELMLPPPLKPALKPVWKVCADFSSPLRWLGQVMQQRAAGSVQPSAASPRARCALSPAPVRRSTEGSTADKWQPRCRGLFQFCVQWFLLFIWSPPHGPCPFCMWKCSSFPLPMLDLETRVEQDFRSSRVPLQCPVLTLE